MTPNASTARFPHVAMSAREPSRRAGSGRRRHVPADSVLVFNPYEPAANSPSPPQPTTRRVPPRKRESFVEANARFALNPEVVRRDRADALEWDRVDLVFVERECTADHAQECPICLHALSAPKITPCGHIFCHPCLLQCVAHSHDNPAEAALDDPKVNIKCPLCSSYFALGALKNLTFRDVAPVQVGQPYELTLVAITNDIVLPYLNHAMTSTKHQLPTDVTNLTTLFSRFCYADRFYISGILTDMARDLRQLLADDPALKPFIDVAAKDVRATKQAIVRTYRHEKPQSSMKPSNASDGSKSERQHPRLVFQASDARNVFLHPANHRCLAHEYDNDLQKSAPNIKGKVLDVERHTMTDALRKRYRFLRHLPNGCEFMLVELDLNGTVSDKTLAHFAKEIKARKEARRKKRVESKREDEGATKHREKEFHDYFRMDQIRARPSAPAHDEATFPSLGGTLANPRDMPIERELGENSPALGTSPGAAWGPNVSSYSNVTSNMGLFPALGSAGRGSNDVAEVAHSPPRGVWATSPTPVLASSPAVTPRRGRTRYTTVSSNAGRAHRR